MEIFIHVGLPRTGTTFLQKNVFPNMDINYISKYNKHIPKSNYIIINNLSKDKINLISDENLYGNVNLLIHQDSNKDIAERLHKLYPNAKIVVVFRDKKTWIKSLYKEFVRSPEQSILVKSYDDWYNNYFNPKSLDFEEYEQVLKKLFSDVLVLHYEELKTDNKLFISKICKFMGIPMPVYENRQVNVSLSNKHIRFIKFCNKLPGKYLFIDNINKLFNKIN